MRREIASNLGDKSMTLTIAILCITGFYGLMATLS